MAAEDLSSLVRCRVKGCVLEEGHEGQHHGPMRSGHLSGPEPKVEADRQKVAVGEERWTLEGRIAGQTVAFGVAPAPGERVEVVRASRFEEVQQERDHQKKLVDIKSHLFDESLEALGAMRQRAERAEAELAKAGDAECPKCGHVRRLYRRDLRADLERAEAERDEAKGLWESADERIADLEADLERAQEALREIAGYTAEHGDWVRHSHAGALAGHVHRIARRTYLALAEVRERGTG